MFWFDIHISFIYETRTNPPIPPPPSRPNSSRSDGLFCPLPRLRRGLLPTFRIRKFLSAEMVRFELTIPCGMPLFESGALNHSATSPFLQIFKYYFEGFYNLDL